MAYVHCSGQPYVSNMYLHLSCLTHTWLNMRSSLASTLLSSFSLFASCNTICDRKQFERDSSRAKSLHLSKYVSQTVAKKLKREKNIHSKSHRPEENSDKEGEFIQSQVTQARRKLGSRGRTQGKVSLHWQ